MSATDPSLIYPIEPILNYRMWGSERLAPLLHQKDQGIFGEAFLLSALTGAESLVDQVPLSLFYQRYPNFFAYGTEFFPLRINLIDTKADLSIQSHPNQKQAENYGYPQQVNEGWYVLACEKHAALTVGHNAENENEFRSLLQENKMSQLLRERTVQPKDFIYLPAGTLHAIHANMLVYEITCNVDVTYRLYDYDRIDPKTKAKRPLQIEEAIASLRYDAYLDQQPVMMRKDGATLITYFDEPNVFTLRKCIVEEEATLSFAVGTFITVTQGEVELLKCHLTPYHSYLVSSKAKNCKIKGNIELLMVEYRQK